MTGSNRRPPACKAGALPAELIPQDSKFFNPDLVGLVGLEPTTPALSTQCSNQLSYRPFPVSLRNSEGSTNWIDDQRLLFYTTADKNGREKKANALVSRKEVIQPHLPIRLPCYDFTPVTNPAVVIALPCGLG